MIDAKEYDLEMKESSKEGHSTCQKEICIALSHFNKNKMECAILILENFSAFYATQMIKYLGLEKEAAEHVKGTII